MLSPAVCLTLVLSCFWGGCRGESEEDAADDPSTYEAAPVLALNSDNVYLIDRQSGQILLDQNSTARMYPASITKIMTVIVALENIADPAGTTVDIDEEVLAGLEEANATRAGFWYGDQPTLLDCMYGALLPSGAECCRALALYVAGSEEAFVEMMNQKAADLGLTDTHFVNTTGLHDDNHYSTCRDIAVLFSYCLENETFRQIITTRSYTSTPVTNYPEGLEMNNSVLMWLTEYEPRYEIQFSIPGFLGGKAGYTETAQYTLVSYAEEAGMELLLVTGHAFVVQYYPANIEDAATIYNWYAQHYTAQTPVQEGEVMGTVSLRNASVDEIEVTSAQTISGDLPCDGNLHIHLELPESLTAPVSTGSVVGKVQVYAYDQLYAEADLLAAESVNASFSGRVKTLFAEKGGAIGLLAAVVIALAYFLSRRRKVSG